MIDTFPSSPDLLAPLYQLPTDAQPKWGVMGPQHMVEHLSLIMRVSNGKINAPLSSPEEKLPRLLNFLRSEAPLPREFKAPGISATPAPLRFAGMEEAIARLEREVADFRTFFKENPEATPIHPVFGPLSFADWVLFHNKHFTHHYAQFGLLPQE
jgi:hypothetical protein